MSDSIDFKVVLFDIDGVLIDVSRSYRRAIEETVAHFTGREIEQGTIQRYKNLGGFNDDWKLTRQIVSDAGISVSIGRIVEEFQRLYRGENWDGFIAEETPLINTRTLDQLTGQFIMGLVTGRPDAEANWSVDRFGWKKYFPLMVSKEKQHGREKPDPFPLQQALAMLDAAGRKIAPTESVYVGDTVDDMRAARSAGMWAIGVIPPYLDEASHGQILIDAGAHCVTADTNAIPDLLADFEQQMIDSEEDL